jgi:hypothetical protein
MSEQRLDLMGSPTSDYDTLDCRSPIMYRDSLPGSAGAVTAWHDAIVRGDAGDIARQMHFPCRIYDDDVEHNYQSAAEFMAQPPRSLDARFQPAGSFRTLESVETRLFRPAVVGCFISGGKYNTGGEKTHTLQAFVSASLDMGKWGVSFASFIAGNASDQGRVYGETVQAATRLLTLMVDGFSRGDQALLDTVWHAGRRAPVDLANFRNLAGSRIGGFAWSSIEKLRLDQHSARKAHAEVVYARRRSDGSVISVSNAVYIVLWKDGRWALDMVGPGATYLDRSNDVAGTVER